MTINDDIREQSPGRGVGPDGQMSIVLDSSLRVMGANDAARRLLGSPLAPGDAFALDRLFPEPHRSEVGSAVKAALTAGAAAPSRKVRANLPGAAEADCLVSIDPVFGPDDQIIGLILNLSRRTDPSRGRPSDGLPDMPRLGYEDLFENLAEGIFTINTRWRITSFNRTAERITGYSRNEVLGRFCWDVFRSDLCDTGCPLRTTLETGLARMDQDVRMMDKGGSPISLLVNTSVLKDDAGTVVGAVETFRPLSGVFAPLSVRSKGHSFADIIGASPVMRRLFEKLPDIAASEANVMIQGESGTGKELFAKAIHAHSPRKDGPFVAVNCSALAETLLESELFGHEKAAFTGAVRSKVGRFELAKGGTLFLDEIGELKPELQVKLLRVLEERVFERVGGTRLIPMDSRIISATNRDVFEALKSGRLREDLFYRLRTVPINLPPLRERREDIPLLVDHFIGLLNEKYGKDVRSVDPKVMKIFMNYDWPGNVRELERAMEHAFVFVKGPVIFERNLPDMEPPRPSTPPPAEPVASPATKPEPSREEIEREAILRALQFCGGRREEAASLLGISRTSLWRKMKALGLSDS